MPASHDVLIDGAGYMLVPGSYHYAVLGADIATIRTGVPSFEVALGIGAGGPEVQNRDQVRWWSVSMLPIPVGLGNEGGRLVLGPGEVGAVTTVAANMDISMRGIVYSGNFYFSQGANLYKIAAGAYGAPTLIGAAAGVITNMAVINGLLYMACASPATTMSNYSGSGAIANTPAFPAQVIWLYASGIWRSKLNAVNGQWDKISGSIDAGATWTDWELDSAIRATVAWHGRATGGGVQLIATGGMLWELAGQWLTTGGVTAFSGTVSPIYQASGGGGTDDFLYLVEYQGHIYTWYAGTIHRWDGVALLPLPAGPRGNIYGMTVAGGYLWVSSFDTVTGVSLFGYDGVRWFRGDLPSGQLIIGMAGTQGVITDGHLIGGRNGTKTLSRWQLPVISFGGTVAASGSVDVGPLDGGQSDAVKAWTQISAAWSTALSTLGIVVGSNPGGNLVLSYSVDDGANWTVAGTTVIAAGARSGLAVQAVNVEAQRLMVRTVWTPTSNYAYWQLDSVYAAGWVIADAPHDERWTMELKLTDKLIKRDGSVDARTGETMLAALRALAQAGRTFVFQDIDFDLSARSVTCRVVEMKEQTRKGDGTHWLESQVVLTIAAVA